MEKSEPALVPEWLRSAGSVAGAGGSAQHSASSSTHTDSPSVAHHARNRSSKNASDFDSSRSVFLERSSSSNSRRSSINGSAKHAYSSFNRSHRDKDRDRDKDRSTFGDHWDRDGSDPLASLFSGRMERDTLRRSHSMVSRKQSDVIPRRVAVDTKSGGSTNQNNGNGILSVGNVSSSIQKVVFDKDFPSLGAEEKQGIAEVGRVSSPGLTATASQSLPVGSSALIGGEGWTSALAEVPTMIGSSSTGSLSVQQTVTTGSVVSSTAAALNMAEALAQTPSRARSTPQVLVKTQRLEELAIKQSRQLIPVTPSMPKALVLNSSEKSKPKTTVRNAEMNVVSKNVPQQPSALHITSQSVRSVNAKVDAPKTSGKFTDLKSVVWENGVSPTSKDVSNPTNYSNSKSVNQHAVSSTAASAPMRNPNNLKSSTERKPALDVKLGSTLDKKHSISQVQSRNDFFNLIKKKTLMNSSTVLPDSGPMVSSPAIEKSDEVNREIVCPSANLQSLGNGAELTSNGNVHTHEEVHRLSDNEEKESISRATIYPDEEEAAFLRSLGWEENSDEDEGLTEEEINAFYQECKKLDPTTLKVCQGMQPNLSKLFESYASNLRGSSAESSSSDPGSEA
ncbi:mediator of RNA polymerase II transcription subunit 1-like isoform X2 [Abrus precatorius]|uniref:Mediator of RNA polymerase II transcription subunit 1-like isoform X2 n=1 Tax=Abrus precatorius TaxID=3816 RepID=A0A8B8JHU0_ABRPR|nr:mediator of RNA polymerase II transcription subunit 1-like isoform X2 [Abrus precatorius]XP_027331024.1 mediator of RNA polymerase II transcription subunit 1-like isoform X2 [Abrus precatorius]XP_027331025.1 mediator of RNA polymerase II transcription subunit 1-like isoform X2 [Abrus precatorius]